MAGFLDWHWVGHFFLSFFVQTVIKCSLSSCKRSIPGTVECSLSGLAYARRRALATESSLIGKRHPLCAY